MMVRHQVRYDVVCGIQEMIDSLNKREQRVLIICRMNQYESFTYNRAWIGVVLRPL